MRYEENNMSVFGDSWGFLIVAFGAWLLRSVPSVLILVAGIMAMKKGYAMSGTALIASSALHLLINLLSGLGMFLGVFSSNSPELTSWVLQGSSLISGVLLAAGVLGIVVSSPKRAD